MSTARRVTRPRSTSAVLTANRTAHATRLLALGVALLGTAACTTPYLPPADADLPVTLRAGPNQHLDRALTARGQSLYECRRDGKALSWSREGDLATLVDAQRRSVGTVAPGGYFVAYDDSYVATKPDAEAQVTAGTLVWARLVPRHRIDEAQGRGANGARGAHGVTSVYRSGTGSFAQTSLIQRVDTTGGLPPNPLCTREGGTLLVPFSATYLIYSPAGNLLSGAPPSTIPTSHASPNPWAGNGHLESALPLPND
ncbi:DUF3455 domain-containing protein [Paraburkholderia sp. BCC1886]|uniref:DUF3455 domain-containing protein n=1 Tax=Paraburkholderia sp. BCC1886 TaxID=2562670 RepID=UPI00164336DF|nr:DUF3455 domain-containing protein [Paraburkholderia sp. BCC1886]